MTRDREGVIGTLTRAGADFSGSVPERPCYAMGMGSTSKNRAAAVRTAEHRKVHRLVQTWVSPEMRKALDARAKSEGRTLANFVRFELGKIVGVAE